MSTQSRIDTAIEGSPLTTLDVERVESLVDGLGESELADQELDGADAAGCDGAGLGGDLEVDVGGGEDRLGRRSGHRLIEPPSDFELAGGVVSVWNRFHWSIFSAAGRNINPGSRSESRLPSESLGRRSVERSHPRSRSHGR
jgi:hypothetical protein